LSDFGGLYRSGFRTKEILCVPVRNRNGDVIAVAELINKVASVSSAFFLEDTNVGVVAVSSC